MARSAVMLARPSSARKNNGSIRVDVASMLSRYERINEGTVAAPAGDAKETGAYAYEALLW